MTFNEAIALCPAEADYLLFRGENSLWRVCTTETKPLPYFIAEVGATGLNFVLEGIRAQGKSLWDADNGRYLCGSMWQMLQ
jgi:hypothetical protein